MSQKEVKKIEDLVEEELSSVTFIQDGRVEFNFNGPIVTSTEPVAEIESQTIRFPDTGSRDALCAFIANKVTAVKLDDPKAITLTFVTGTIRIPIPAADRGHVALFKLTQPPTVAIRALDPLFLSLADAYWAHFLGCSTVKLRNDRTHLLSRAELGDYAGCYIIQFGGAPVVSLPANEINLIGTSSKRGQLSRSESFHSPSSFWRKDQGSHRARLYRLHRCKAISAGYQRHDAIMS